MDKDSIKHYLTNISERDNEHLSFFAQLDELKDLIMKKETLELIESKFNVLLEMWVEHANSEERFLSEIKFPYMQYHVTLHTELFSKLVKISKHKAYSVFLISEIEKQFSDHIDQYDFQYVDWYTKINVNHQ